MQQAHYRISAKALIWDDDGRVLLCRESSGVWDLPGGGLDHGEDVVSCIEREVSEEM